MRRWARGIVALAVFGGAAPAAAESPALLVLVPPGDSVVSGGGHAHVVVDVGAGLSPADVRTQVKGVDVGPGIVKTRSNGRTIVHWTLRLVPGPSPIEITLGDPTQPRARERRMVFLHEPVLSPEEPPVNFRVAPFHRPDTEAACAECHTMTPTASDFAPATPEQSTCYRCHAPLTRTKAVHGPAALWACTKCHDPTTAPSRYVTPRPVMPLCFGCHQEQKDRFYGNPYQHGPTATGFCTICHNPHGTDNEYFVKKAVWYLCTTCHFEKGSGRHVVAWGPNGQSHPTRNRPDPSRVGKELSCASCHNPHAAPGVRLWNFGATRWIDLCKNCHPQIFGVLNRG